MTLDTYKLNILFKIFKNKKNLNEVEVESTAMYKFGNFGFRYVSIQNFVQDFSSY